MNQFLETIKGVAIAALLLIGMSSSAFFGSMVHDEDIDDLPATALYLRVLPGSVRGMARR